MTAVIPAMCPSSRRFSSRCSNSGIEPAGVNVLPLLQVIVAATIESVRKTETRFDVRLFLLFGQQSFVTRMIPERIEVGIVLYPFPVTEACRDCALEETDGLIGLAAD
jgi:hypothetical protein